MPRRFLSPLDALIAIGSLIVFLVLLYLTVSNPLSTPASAFRSIVAGENRNDLEMIKNASTDNYYQNFIGHFGEIKFHQVRAVYDEAYRRAEPVWLGYRQKAETLSRGAYNDLHLKVERLGKEAVDKLPLEQRLQLTEDRQKYADTIFDEGVKALTAEERDQVGDVRSFRAYANLKAFTDHYGWALLSDADRTALGKPAAFVSGINAEKTAFFERIGLPLLKKEQQEFVATIPSSELSDPRTFMLRYGQELARQFLANANIGTTLLSEKCSIAEEDYRGSLVQGSAASCSGAITVRSTSHQLSVSLQKSGANWRIVRISPDFYNIREAYPPPSARRLVTDQPSAPTPISAPYGEQGEQLLMPSIPNARWEALPETSAPVIESWLLTALLPKSIWLVLSLIAVVSIIAVKTVNFRRRLLVKEEPILLDNETAIKSILVRNFLSRSSTRLTDHRVVQSRIWWWLSRRTADSIPLADVQAIFWQRWMNWPLILVAIYLIGRCNPVALILLMIGLEAKIYSVLFKRSFFHLPNSGIAVRSSRRRQFSELWNFFQFAQLQWLGRRSGRQMTPESTTYSDVGPDRDFQFGPVVWAAIGLATLISFAQRFTGHVTLYDGVLGPVLLALPVAAGRQKLRDGLLTAVFALSAVLCIKFPDFGVIPGLGSDGGHPNPMQYLVVLVTFCVVALFSALLSRLVKELASLALFLWVPFAAFLDPQDFRDPIIYARLALAVTISVALCIAYAIIAERRSQAAVAKASASGASAGTL